MNTKSSCQIVAIVAPLVSSSASFGQGTFLYDQESSVNEIPPVPAAGTIIQQNSPLGQSFTPSLTGIDFIRLKLSDNDAGNGLGATILLELRTGSITGTRIGLTGAVG